MERLAFYSHIDPVRKQKMVEILVQIFKEFEILRDSDLGAMFINWRSQMYRAGGGFPREAKVFLGVEHWIYSFS